MPHLRIQTNQHLDPDSRQRLLAAASAGVGQALGKAERYVMVTVESDRSMRFAGDDAPCAYMELKSIGLPESRTPALSRALCDMMREQINVPPERVYIEFTNAKASLWGWNGATF